MAYPEDLNIAQAQAEVAYPSSDFNKLQPFANAMLADVTESKSLITGIGTIVELTPSNNTINAQGNTRQFVIHANGTDFDFDIDNLAEGEAKIFVGNHFQDTDGVFDLTFRGHKLPVSKLPYREENGIILSGATAITIYCDGSKININTEVTEKTKGPIIIDEAIEPEVGVVGEVPYVAWEIKAFGYVDATWYNQEGITTNKTLGVVLSGDDIKPGSWQCKLTDQYGNVTWSESVLVRLAPKLAVTITNQPTVNDSEPPINVGVNFTGLTYVGNPTPTKQWKYDVDGGSTQVISGATSDTLIGWVPPVPPGIDPLTVRVWATLNNNFGDPVDTDKITLTVAKHAVVVTVQPVLSSDTIAAGSSVTVQPLEYTASPLGTIVWKYNNLTASTVDNVIAGETGLGITSWTPPLPTDDNPLELQVFAVINNGVGSPVTTDMLALTSEKAEQPAPVTSFEGIEDGEVVYRTPVVSGRTLEYTTDRDSGTPTWQDITTFIGGGTTAELVFTVDTYQAKVGVRFKGTTTKKASPITILSQDYLLLEDITSHWTTSNNFANTNTNSPTATANNASISTDIIMASNTIIYMTLNQSPGSSGGAAAGINGSAFLGGSSGSGNEATFAGLDYCFGLYDSVPKMYQLGSETILTGPVVGDILRFPGSGNVQYSHDGGNTFQNCLVSGSPVSINLVGKYVKACAFSAGWGLYNIKKSL